MMSVGMEAADLPDGDAETLLQFVYLCPVALLQTDRLGAVQMLNPMAVQLLLPVTGDGEISNLFDALEHCAPELRNTVDSFPAPFGRICSNHRISVTSTRDKACRDRRVFSCSILKVDADTLMVMLDDITIQALQERRLAEADAWMGAIFSNVNDFACFSLDGDGRISTWNPSGVRQTGYDAADVLGQPISTLYPAGGLLPGGWVAQLERVRREGWALQEGQCVARNGRSFWCQLLLTVLSDDAGELTGFSVVLRDITERKMTADELRRLLTSDHLTGASNRAHFFEMAQREVTLRRGSATQLSLLMIDADHFKRVNDRFGHASGDCVLKELAERSRRAIREGDTFARFGGEEFIALMPGADVEEARVVAERIRSSLSARPIPLPGGATFSVTVSIGCASMGNGIESLEALINAADEALYAAKALGRNQASVHRPMLVSRLEESVGN